MSFEEYRKILNTVSEMSKNQKYQKYQKYQKCRKSSKKIVQLKLIFGICTPSPTGGVCVGRDWNSYTLSTNELYYTRTTGAFYNPDSDYVVESNQWSSTLAIVLYIVAICCLCAIVGFGIYLYRKRHSDADQFDSVNTGVVGREETADGR